jgi:hypothetical protein
MGNRSNPIRNGSRPLTILTLKHRPPLLNNFNRRISPNIKNNVPINPFLSPTLLLLILLLLLFFIVYPIKIVFPTFHKQFTGEMFKSEPKLKNINKGDKVECMGEAVVFVFVVK